MCRGRSLTMWTSNKTLTLTTAALGLLGCADLDRVVCDNGNCGWSSVDSARLSGLADLPEVAPPDPSNKYAGNPAAEALGRKFFWDTRFSGVSRGTDAISRP